MFDGGENRGGAEFRWSSGIEFSLLNKDGCDAVAERSVLDGFGFHCLIGRVFDCRENCERGRVRESRVGGGEKSEEEEGEEEEQGEEEEEDLEEEEGEEEDEEREEEEEQLEEEDGDHATALLHPLLLEDVLLPLSFFPLPNCPLVGNSA
ncbi:MAG: hypothetical protein J3R72DRAFT_417674 [Linnemannia gamsii]|nr:MAG: hypothetical protein J3R72DRAFT_417674 [Linnemannia gamsii]